MQGTLLSHTCDAFMTGGSCPKLKSSPDEHMGEKVPVVTIELPSALRTPQEAEMRKMWQDLLRWTHLRLRPPTS